MVKIVRPNLPQGGANAFISSPGVSGAAIGQSLVSAGQQLQSLDVGGPQKAINQAIVEESQRQMANAATSIQTSVLNDNLSKATVEYDQLLRERQSRSVDDKGNPVYHTLVEDTKRIGDQVLSKYMGNIALPDVRNKLSTSFNNIITNKQLHSMSVARKQQLDHAKASYDNLKIVKLEEAKSGSLEAINEPLGELEDALNQRVIAGEITESERDADLRAAKKDVLVSQYTRIIRDKPANAVEILSQGSKVSGLDTDTTGLLLDKAKLAVKALKQSEKAQVKAIRQQTEFAFKQADQMIQAGNDLPDELVTYLQGVAKGNKEIEDQVRGILVRNNAAQDFVTLSSAERTQKIMELGKVAILDEEASKLKKDLVELDKQLDKQLKEDPVGLSIKQKLVEDTPLLDVSGNIGQQIANRANIRAISKSEYGVDTAGLRDSEIQDLDAHLNSLPEDQQLNLLATIRAAAGSPEAAGELFGKIRANGSSMRAYAGMLVSEGRRGLAKEILDGQKLLKDKTIAGLQGKELALKLKGKLPNYYRAEQAEDVIKAIKNLYASRASRSGDVDPLAPNYDILEQAIKDATNGGIIDFNDSKLEPPEHGMSSGDFKDWVNSINQSDIDALGGLETEDAVRVIRTANLQNIGRGKYLVHPTDPLAPDVLTTKSGKLFILDYNKIKGNR